MTIVLTGGGTGGHITPLLAVAHELKRIQPDCHIVYIGERGNKFTELTKDTAVIDQVCTIWAGKFRRYYGQSKLERLLDIKTNLLNLRDLFYFLFGTVQSWFLLGRIKPDAILLKGGFVGVPVGLAAAARKLPFMTHDSDTLPGLANRIVGRWARLHAVAQEASTYPYPEAKTKQVGVLVDAHFSPVSKSQQAAFKQQIGIPDTAPMLLITGGSSGAQAINEAIAGLVEWLLSDNPTLHIVHQVGKGKTAIYKKLQHERLHVVEFMQPMYVYTGAADVVVARASANTLAELGVQKKAVIVIASPYLAEGHQLKNAARFALLGAAVNVQETRSGGVGAAELETAISELLRNKTKRTELAEKLHAVTISDATPRLAMLLLDIAK